MTSNNTNSGLGDSGDDFTTYPAYKAGALIWKIVPPILLILGTVGNFLSILVLTRRSIRSSTTAIYLIGLACSDLLVLYSGLFRQWLIYLFNTDVRETSPFGCKLNIWLVYTSLDFSAWILMAVTLERVISAWLPHNARTMCTKKSALAFIISIGVFLLALNSHLLYGMDFVEQYDEDTGAVTIAKCKEVDRNYRQFFNHTWPWIDFSAFCLIPFSVIVVGNAMILFKVVKSQRKTHGQIAPSLHTRSNNRQQPSHHAKQSSMTAMLFTLNIVFLFSTSPVSIYNIGYPHWQSDASNHKLAELDLWWAIVNMFMYTNNSLNFLLYCLSGTKFRQEVRRIFCKTKLFRRQTQMPLSNYTRTKFDKSAHPSPPSRSINGHSAEKATPSTQESMKLISVNEQPVHNNNLLHPDSALKITCSDLSLNIPIQTVSEKVNETVNLTKESTAKDMPSIDV